MFLNKSLGRKRFKGSLGNANHLIITSLVGLDAIERGLVKGIPPEMRTVWSPKSPKNSARRARRMVLDMALIRAVDAIDVYIRDAMRLPTLIQDDKLRSGIHQANRSIFKKIVALDAAIPGLDALLSAMIAVLVSWRNESAHSEADDVLSEKHRAVLEANNAKIASLFSGLDSNMMLNDYDSETPPAFKEIASLINASHHFIQNLEGQLFARLDPDMYLKQLVRSAIQTKSSDRPGVNNKGSKIAEIWGRNPCDRPRYVRSLLQHNGLALTKAKNGPFLEFDQGTIENLSAYTPKELANWLTQ